MFKVKKGFVIGLSLLLVLLMAVSGCSSESSSTGTEKETGAKDSKDSGKPKQGGEVVIGYYTDVSNYDPIKGSSGSDHALLWPVYDTLISFTPDLEPKPGLAKTWEFPNNKTIVLHLREGVTFHDGTPFNAKAVKFNIERINSEMSKISDLQNIKSVEIVDPLTVKLHLKQPDSSILLALSDRAGMMVSPTAVKKYGEDYSQHPTGAGPFKMVERVPNGKIVFKAYEDYWQEGKPYLDKLTIRVMAKENTRINALKSGEIDFAAQIKPGTANSLKGNPNIVLKKVIPVKFRKIYLNTAMEPFNNKAVRLAVLYGINREAIIKAINFGQGEAADQPFPSGYWAYNKDVKIKYNPEKSKQLLEEAGLDNVSFKMLHYPNAYESRLAEAIAAQLEKVGINVELQAMELQAAVAKYFSEKSVPAFLSSWTGRPDPQMTINYLYSKESFYNVGRSSTPELEKLISKAAASYKMEKRAKLYGKISKVALFEQAEEIPLFFPPIISAINKKVKGYVPNKLGKPKFSTIWLAD